MAEALTEAAADAGIRITLLDTLYLHGGLDGESYRPASAAQRRFCDATVAAWIDRVSSLARIGHRRVGAAVHSVRAVDPLADRDTHGLGRR